MGYQGLQGIQGFTGPTGAAGVTGSQGSTGPQGQIGPFGGPPGPVGPQGPLAVSGATASLSNLGLLNRDSSGNVYYTNSSTVYNIVGSQLSTTTIPVTPILSYLTTTAVYTIDAGTIDGQLKTIVTYASNVGLKSTNNIIWNGIIQNSTIYALGIGSSLTLLWSTNYSCWIIINGIGFSL